MSQHESYDQPAPPPTFNQGGYPGHANTGLPTNAAMSLRYAKNFGGDQGYAPQPTNAYAPPGQQQQQQYQQQQLFQHCHRRQ
ncbi:hypothetical protein BGX23_006065 [Mortierella sp. AD031]|nr:hypothetical protein BGX23_006065 [Mortierella sp. AD031]